MKKLGRLISATIVLLTIMTCIVATGRVATAELCIPEGAEITSAIFSIYSINSPGQVVNLHRITAPWAEQGVTWNNFGGSYDPNVEGSFNTDTAGWHIVDVTSLVQSWVDGSYDNYGFLLEQGNNSATLYRSSEFSDAGLRPSLEICYSYGLGNDCVTIQRPGAEQDGVADAYIWELESAKNGNFNSDILYTGNVQEYEKQSLIRFVIEICPEEGPGTGTPGYWKTHPEAWPVTEITIGGITYSSGDAISKLWMPEKGDKTFTVFRALVAAKLNVLIGNDDSCISDTIAAADEWMAEYGPGSGVRGNSDAWKNGEPLYLILDDYNNGLLCAPERD